MNFYQALDIANKFMEESGIREYCTTVCKGSCCYGCEHCLNENNIRPIGCVAYICLNLKALLFPEIPEVPENSYYLNIHDSIIDILLSHFLEATDKSPYFENPTTIKKINKVKFPNYINSLFNRLNPKRIRSKMEILLERR